MRKISLLLLFISYSITLFRCSQEDIDELMGKKKEKTSCTLAYVACVARYENCFESGQCDPNNYNPISGTNTEKAQYICSGDFVLCAGWIMGGASAGQ